MPLTFSRTDYPLPVSLWSVSIGDFNHDGYADLVTANIDSNGVSVLLGNGDGTFGAATTFATGVGPANVAIADLNGDGNLDLTTSNVNSNNVSVLLGNGLGGFGPASSFGTGVNPRWVALGDLNGDGKLDFVTGNQSSNGISVALGSGDGTFGAATDMTIGAGTHMAVGLADLNGDGKLDAAVIGDPSSHDLFVLLGNGDGTFGAAVNYQVGLGPDSVAFGDFNGDGHLDLAVRTSGSVTVSVLLGNGDGTFGAATNFGTATAYAVGPGAGSVVTADLDGDGKLDLIVNGAVVLLGAGDGTFGPPTNVAAASGTSFVAVGDLDGIGLPDLAVTTYSPGSIAVLLNTSTAANEPPTITSNGGNDTATVSVAENSTAVTTVAATDPDAGQTLSYSIFGGADAALFNINATTGALAFVSAPNFEVPTDAGANNVYDVTVRALDGVGGIDTQAIAVTVTNKNEAPVVTGPVTGNATEDGPPITLDPLANASDVDDTMLSVTNVPATLPAGVSFVSSTHPLGIDDIIGVSIPVGSNDGVSHPSLDNVWSVSAPPFPFNDNIGIGYLINPSNQTDLFSLHDHHYIAPNVPDPNRAVITFHFASPTVVDQFDVVEHANGITKLHGYVGNSLDSLTDIGAIFGSLGDLTGYAQMFDGEHNIFDFNNTVGGTYFQVVIDKTALADGYAFFRMFPEVASAGFTLDPSNAAYQYLAAGEQTTVTVNYAISDGTSATPASMSWTVTGVNDDPTITSDGGSTAAALSVAENITAVTTVTATDPDAGTVLAYSIFGGADAALFNINATTGALAFVTAPNFEVPTDAGANNVYDVTVRALDGVGGIDTQAIAVTVTNANEAPTITSNGGGDTAAVSVAENITAVTTVTATDPDAGTVLAYSIFGGADAALFNINATTGALAFVTAPNFEVPTDAGANNVYDVTVRALDGVGGIDTQAIAVTVTNANEAPTITSNGGGDTAAVSVAENTTAVTAVTATDPDAGQTLSYSIFGGADAARFTVNATTGALAFVTAPNFEAPTDSDHNNSYIVRIQASDGSLVDTQTITVNVTNVNEAPVITSNGGGDTAAVSVAENTTAVTAVTATDPDAGQTLSYSIFGGADAARFTVNATTGVLAFVTAPNFEVPTDAGANNVYDVTVQASDGVGGIDTQAIAVTVTNVVGATIVGGNHDQTLNGTGEEDNISGGNGKDILNGGAGNDTLTGGNGKDTFVFGANFGKDVITDFHNDTIQFDHTVFANFTDVQAHFAQVGANTVITHDANDTVTLLGVTLASLHASDFLFV